MAADIDCIICNCTSCARSSTKYRHKRSMHLFSASGSLEFGAMDIVGPLPKTTQGIQHISVISDCYSKLARAVPTSRTTATHVANVSIDHFLISYSISKYELADNGTQFVGKLFATVCALFGGTHIATTAYYPQRNGQAKRLKKPSSPGIGPMLQNFKRIETPSFSR